MSLDPLSLHSSLSLLFLHLCSSHRSSSVISVCFHSTSRATVHRKQSIILRIVFPRVEILNPSAWDPNWGNLDVLKPASLEHVPDLWAAQREKICELWENLKSRNTQWTDPQYKVTLLTYKLTFLHAYMNINNSVHTHTQFTHTPCSGLQQTLPCEIHVSLFGLKLVIIYSSLLSLPVWHKDTFTVWKLEISAFKIIKQWQWCLVYYLWISDVYGCNTVQDSVFCVLNHVLVLYHQQSEDDCLVNLCECEESADSDQLI